MTLYISVIKGTNIAATPEMVIIVFLLDQSLSIFFFICVRVLPACVSIHHIPALPVEDRS